MEKELTDAIYNKVYEYRVLKRMSQKELADAVGVSRQTIFLLEKKTQAPSLLMAFRLASYFNVEVNDIFHYEKKHN
ncbi:helix-turn-helix transcriptional regulator [Vagococcus sp. BWB3-3]|uniref:Helix-turn-helix transcriptional regulator n=1 Tax=Vagococcus allomyrinae TaxID=2794353 RepID=A0A940PG88_9ENTE|nr:helix-turn-helix transcriptional regulator [Vagococcus allomyrinae]MBP1044304.1 helix-turn-helix transcriptional regulator [Vagococcus allomyrinae]